MTIKHAPCPFCGCTELREIDAWIDTDKGEEEAVLIECMMCDSQARREWWNKRSPMAEVQEIMRGIAE